MSDVGPLSLLPESLAARSLSRSEIILPLAEALQAVEYLTGAERRISAWEGWIAFPDGMRVKSLEHSGSFVLPVEPRRAAERAAEQMRAAQARWERRPEYPDAELRFHLSVS